MAAREQFVVDQTGKRTGVLLDVEYYERLLEALDEIESLRAFDEAKASGNEVIPFAQAVDEIERQR